MGTVKKKTRKVSLTPNEMLGLARSAFTKPEWVALIEQAKQAALEGDSKAREFLLRVLFPKGMEKEAEKRVEKVVFEFATEADRPHDDTDTNQ